MHAGAAHACTPLRKTLKPLKRPLTRRLRRPLKRPQAQTRRTIRRRRDRCHVLGVVASTLDDVVRGRRVRRVRRVTIVRVGVCVCV